MARSSVEKKKCGELFVKALICSTFNFSVSDPVKLFVDPIRMRIKKTIDCKRKWVYEFKVNMTIFQVSQVKFYLLHTSNPKRMIWNPLIQFLLGFDLDPYTFPSVRFETWGFWCSPPQLRAMQIFRDFFATNFFCNYFEGRCCRAVHFFRRFRSHSKKPFGIRSWSGSGPVVGAGPDPQRSAQRLTLTLIWSELGADPKSVSGADPNPHLERDRIRNTWLQGRR